MTSRERIADAMRGSYALEYGLDQGESYCTWEELSPVSQEFWRNVAKRTENRLARDGLWIVNFGDQA